MTLQLCPDIIVSLTPLLLCIATGVMAKPVSKVVLSNIVSIDPQQVSNQTCDDLYSRGTITMQDTKEPSVIQSPTGDSVKNTQFTNQNYFGINVLTEVDDITFANVKQPTTKTVRIYATQLSKGSPFSGVFTDGACKGNISITKLTK